MTTLAFARRTLGVLVAAATSAAALAGCGRVGPLEQPPPLYGRAAKHEYDQRLTARQRATDASDERRSTTAQGSAEREANTLDDDAPLTTRDVKDPNTELTTPRDVPVPGAPDPLGPTVSTTPPNR